MALKPICVPCQRFFKPETTGFSFVEAKPIKNFALPGTADPAAWVPYKLWRGDLWKCQGCGSEIVVGVGNGPVSQDYLPTFNDDIVKHESKLQVNDC
jgi:hypothetical protein